MSIRRVGACLVLAGGYSLAGVAAAGMGAPVQAAPLQASCASAGYSHNNSVCMVVPSHGSFTIKVPSTSVKLKGSGSGSTAGTQITVSKVPPPHPASGAVGIKVRATGKFNALKVNAGTLWKYSAGSNKLTKAKAIKGPGVYQVTK